MADNIPVICHQCRLPDGETGRVVGTAADQLGGEVIFRAHAEKQHPHEYRAALALEKYGREEEGR